MNLPRRWSSRASNFFPYVASCERSADLSAKPGEQIQRSHRRWTVGGLVAGGEMDRNGLRHPFCFSQFYVENIGTIWSHFAQQFWFPLFCCNREAGRRARVSLKVAIDRRCCREKCRCQRLGLLMASTRQAQGWWS